LKQLRLTSVLTRPFCAARASLPEPVDSQSNLALVFLGAPGVGKGTYSSRVGPLFGLHHVSTGNLVREEIRRKTTNGKLIEGLARSGKLAPDGLVIDLLLSHLDSLGGKGFILDGFPRTLMQAKMLTSELSLDAVIQFHCSDEIILAKLSGRRVCGGCGENYNLAHIRFPGMDMPPILPKVPNQCDRCEGALIQRADDTEEVVHHRLTVYKKETGPIEKHLSSLGLVRDFHIDLPTNRMAPKLVHLMNQIHLERDERDLAHGRFATPQLQAFSQEAFNSGPWKHAEVLPLA